MSEESPTSASPNGTPSMHDTDGAVQREVQQPAVRRAIIANAHVLQRGAGHEEHSGDDVSEGEGLEREVIANDEGTVWLGDPGSSRMHAERLR